MLLHQTYSWLLPTVHRRPNGGGKYASLDIKERMTTPPTYLTESELISKMEHHGIGTDASISTHIENILKRNYVELIAGRKLKPSRLGLGKWLWFNNITFSCLFILYIFPPLVLAQGYHLIDDSLVLPKIRSDIEDQCVQIAKGLVSREDVVKRAIEIFSSKFRNFCENINKMDVLFSSSFAQLQDVGKPFTRCGLTRRYLQFITGPPPRLYNKTTEVSSEALQYVFSTQSNILSLIFSCYVDCLSSPYWRWN